MSAKTPLKIALLGATGSIGQSTLDVVASFPDRFQIAVMSARRRTAELERAAELAGCSWVVVESNSDAQSIQARHPNWQVDVGEAGLISAVTASEVDLVVNGIVGFAGLVPTVQAIEAGKRVATANKESIVVGGELLLDLIGLDTDRLIPIDSEHSAIWSILRGHPRSDVEKVILTASGGAFRDLPVEAMQHVRAQDALKHPNWDMGAKITIDCATMVNKGFEVIEAHYLFGLDYDAIDTIIHRESLIHSMVQMVDGEIYAQIGPTDMRFPIQNALSYPEVLPNKLPRLNLADVGRLSFAPVDPAKYPLLDLVYDVGREGGLMPAVFNAANEEIVAAFLQGHLNFLEIEPQLRRILEEVPHQQAVSLDALLAIDRETRARVSKNLQQIGASAPVSSPR